MGKRLFYDPKLKAEKNATDIALSKLSRNEKLKRTNIIFKNTVQYRAFSFQVQFLLDLLPAMDHLLIILNNDNNPMMILMIWLQKRPFLSSNVLQLCFKI
ncbi:hypothetical protein T03_9199 [Trichinella britovi]|uniref:Uncharacterized protein n=1 Tax=Trichinella britovi TaxID=45882 RepID=A0A0V1D8Z8_TRIBR|nr:hypothetical protein T03_9199 [Trichinella britovi]